MYEFITNLVGTLPTEFEFAYVIITIVLTMLILSFLFTLFYIPILLLRK